MKRRTESAGVNFDEIVVKLAEKLAAQAAGGPKKRFNIITACQLMDSGRWSKEPPVETPFITPKPAAEVKLVCDNMLSGERTISQTKLLSNLPWKKNYLLDHLFTSQALERCCAVVESTRSFSRTKSHTRAVLKLRFKASVISSRPKVYTIL